MAGFCSNCGAPVLGQFCTQCGARAAAPATAPAQAAPRPVQAYPAPVAQAQPVAPVQIAPLAPVRKSGLGKILLWIGAIVFVLFLAAAGATVYGYYWVKHKVTNYASAITGGSSEPMKTVANGNSCRLLSAADLQRVLGVAIEKSAEIEEGSEPGCAYYTNPTAVAQLQRMAMEQARKQAQQASAKPGEKVDNPLALLKETNQMEGIVKSFGLSNPDNNGKVFSFTVQRNFDESAWSGMRLVQAAVPGFEDVPGVADHAMIAAFGHGFYAMKGDTMIYLDTTLVPDARMRGSQIVKKIFGNL